MQAKDCYDLPVRVLIIGHWFLNRLNQEKLDRLAELEDVELMALMPRRWRGSLGETYGSPGQRPRAYRIRRGQTVLEGAININLHLYLSGLTEALRIHRPHLVQVDEEPYCPVSFQVAALKRIFGYRMICFSYQNLNKQYPQPFRWMEAFTLARTDLLIAGNAEVGQVFADKGFKGPIEVIPHGMNLGLYRDARPAEIPGHSGRFTIGLLGRVEQEKGVQVLMSALERLSDPPQLLVVGSGPMMPQLRQWAAGRPEQQLCLIDRVPHADVGRYLKRMDLVCVPSLTHSGWKEQLGRVILEAMAAGVPVVASDSGEIPTTADGAALLCPEGDPAALAAAIERIRSEPALRESLRQKGQRRAADFGWQSVTSEIGRAYRRVQAVNA